MSPYPLWLRHWGCYMDINKWRSNWQACILAPALCASGSWLPRANGTTDHYEAIHCSRWTRGAASRHTTPPNTHTRRPSPLKDCHVLDDNQRVRPWHVTCKIKHLQNMALYLTWNHLWKCSENVWQMFYIKIFAKMLQKHLQDIFANEDRRWLHENKTFLQYFTSFYSIAGRGKSTALKYFCKCFANVLFYV